MVEDYYARYEGGSTGVCPNTSFFVHVLSELLFRGYTRDHRTKLTLITYSARSSAIY